MKSQGFHTVDEDGDGDVDDDDVHTIFLVRQQEKFEIDHPWDSLRRIGTKHCSGLYRCLGRMRRRLPWD